MAPRGYLYERNLPRSRNVFDLRYQSGVVLRGKVEEGLMFIIEMWEEGKEEPIYWGPFKTKERAWKYMERIIKNFPGCVILKMFPIQMLRE